MRYGRLASATILVATVLSTSTLVYAQASGKPANGEEVFKRVCASCHISRPPERYVLTPQGPPPEMLVARALPPERLKMFTPEAILNTLTNGKMQAQAAGLTDAERRAVSEYVTGQTFSALEAARKNSQCKTPLTGGFDKGGRWNGWGNGVTNTRFQPKEQGKLTAAELPRLKLKWAFGYANVVTARAQPAVVGERLFAASENTDVYALNAKTGCSYWTYKAQAGVRAALSVGPYTADGKKGTAVFFGDQKANMYAVDADTGKLIWTRKLDDHRAAGITGAPTLYNGVLYVPVQGIGEEAQGVSNNYQCCTFRGSIVALDANAGSVLWKTYTIGEPKPRGKSKAGVQLYGPAGGGIWSAPTVDAKRGLVYAGTGNGYALPAQPMTNAIIALDMKTGAVKWTHQIEPVDIWAMGCKAKNPENPECPPELGPDYDFSASPALVKVNGNGRELLVVPQKAAIAHALDPDNGGKIVWQFRFGQGSGLGGQWGGAFDAENGYFGTGDLLTPTPGGMHAVRLADGKEVWSAPPQEKFCGDEVGCSAGQGGALTGIPGAVLNTAMDGGIRAYSTKDGSIIWKFDTFREFETVNGIRARGGSMDGAGPVVADGMVYVNSGYGGLIGVPGNVLLAFGPE